MAVIPSYEYGNLLTALTPDLSDSLPSPLSYVVETLPLSRQHFCT